MAQLIYDSTMILIPLRRYSRLVNFSYIAIRCISGLVATSITNILASVVVYAVFQRATYDINKTLKYTKPLILVPAIAIGIMVAVSQALDDGNDLWSYIYGGIRVVSILINLILYIVLTITLYLRNRNSTKKNCPLEVLVNRFKYYPLVQVVSRAAVVIHEVKYGFEYYYEDGEAGGMQKQVSLYFYVVTLPSLGVLYFLVFLNVSPGAYSTLRHTTQRILRSMGSFFCYCLDLFPVDEALLDDEAIKANNKPVYYGEKGSSFCSDNSHDYSSSGNMKCFSSGSGGLEEILLSGGKDHDRDEDDGGSRRLSHDHEHEHSSHTDNTGESTDKFHLMESTGAASGLDINEVNNIIIATRAGCYSQYYDYDEEDLITEIDKLYRESLVTLTTTP